LGPYGGSRCGGRTVERVTRKKVLEAIKMKHGKAARGLPIVTKEMIMQVARLDRK